MVVQTCQLGELVFVRRKQFESKSCCRCFSCCCPVVLFRPYQKHAHMTKLVTLLVCCVLPVYSASSRLYRRQAGKTEPIFINGQQVGNDGKIDVTLEQSASVHQPTKVEGDLSVYPRTLIINGQKVLVPPGNSTITFRGKDGLLHTITRVESTGWRN